MPKKVKALSDRRTVKKRQADFLAQFMELAAVSPACRKAKVPRGNIYLWQKNDLEFKQAFDEACVVANAALEDEAIRRGYEGVLKPIYQGGKKVGTVREYSDTLLIFLMKGRMPEKYKDRVANEHTGKDGAPIHTEVKHTVVFKKYGQDDQRDPE
jgi:hypothetical protein